MSTVTSIYGERFTHRLEAFSDLVFGFSLSLLATRLDLPANVSEVFAATRWGTFIVTFAIICVIWLAHYGIFRHEFVAQTPDVIINFIFLLGIAVLPYAVQTYLRFPGGRDAIVLYFGDFALVFAALATLRWRALRQRRGAPDVEERMREWRRAVRQYLIVVDVVVCLIGLIESVIPTEKFYTSLIPGIIVASLLARFAVQRLPGFLQ
jgi:uncharacterized membrane protein